MKRITSIIIVLLIIFSFAACKAENESRVNPESCEHTYSSEITKAATYDEEGEITYTCTKCGDTHTEPLEKLPRPVVSKDDLNDALSKVKYYNDPFSISVGELVNSTMDSYYVTYYTGEEAIEKGLITKSQIASSVDINFLYYAVISGDTMMNPDIPYLTEYNERALEVWMVFDENNRLIDSGVSGICSDLQTCAILIMTSF